MRNVRLLLAVVVGCFVPLAALAQPDSATLHFDPPIGPTTGNVQVHINSTGGGPLSTGNVFIDSAVDIDASLKALKVVKAICVACGGVITPPNALATCSDFDGDGTDDVVGAQDGVFVHFNCPGTEVVRGVGSDNITISKRPFTNLQRLRSVVVTDSANEQFVLTAASTSAFEGFYVERQPGALDGTMTITWYQGPPGPSIQCSTTTAGKSDEQILDGLRTSCLALSPPITSVIVHSIGNSWFPQAAKFRKILFFTQPNQTQAGVLAPPGFIASIENSSVPVPASGAGTPTLSPLGIFILALLLAFGTWWMLRRQRMARQA